MNFIHVESLRYPVSEAEIVATHMNRKQFIATNNHRKYERFGFKGVLESPTPVNIDLFSYVTENVPLERDGAFYKAYVIVPVNMEIIGQRKKLLENIKKYLNTLLDNTAIAHDYNSIDEAVSYADELSVPKYANEGKAFRTWRSLIWNFYDGLVIAERDTETLPYLTMESFLEALPVFSLPE